MTGNMSHLKLLVLLFFFIGISNYGQKYQDINSTVKKYSEKKLLKNAQWALYAKYYDTGEEIIAYNQDMSLAPASGLKVITSSAALGILGQEYRFDTMLYYDGVIEEGVLDGDIIILGGGDPCLGSDAVSGSLNLDDLMSVWIRAIGDLGIVQITGSILADELKYESNPVPDHWEWIDLGNYYAAPSSALSINDNLYYLYFKPGERAGDEAEFLRTEPEIPGLSFTNFMKTGAVGSGDNGYVYSAPLQFDAALRGTVPAGNKELAFYKCKRRTR
jgi:D-alanyl-D-alanine carboxypeptidase/D-alanyl-D-alanine-endopeptidase (penicillin-binding protein 4)